MTSAEVKNCFRNSSSWSWRFGYLENIFGSNLDSIGNTRFQIFIYPLGYLIFDANIY